MAMKLLRLKLIPVTAWATPWQADTLLGMLAAVYGRVRGPDRLEEDLLTPWRRGEPPFVVSDAFPGDLLPAPASLTLWPWPDTERRQVKRTEWLSPAQFAAVQSGRQPSLTEIASPPFRSWLRIRNTLNRTSNATGDAGSLYEVPVTLLSKQYSYLSLYIKVEPDKEKLFGEALSFLADSGFGADTSVGQGHFRILENSGDVNWLSSAEHADAWISLSTFQPASHDPTIGYWQSFVKYGKLGPQFGIDNVFKKPQWMLRSGACFRQGGVPKDRYGRLIDTGDLLPQSVLAQLASKNVRPVHPAFALAVPMKWAEEYRQ
jgi:CRISPR-associated protein Csm4